MDLILRSIGRRPQMQLSMARRFKLQQLRRYSVKFSKKHNFTLGTHTVCLKHEKNNKLNGRQCQPGGPIRQPYSYSVLGPPYMFKNASTGPSYLLLPSVPSVKMTKSIQHFVIWQSPKKDWAKIESWLRTLEYWQCFEHSPLVARSYVL